MAVHKKDVYVVMGNDFPDAVFSSLAVAEAHCVERQQAEIERNKRENRQFAPTIYWRVYPFPLDGKSRNLHVERLTLNEAPTTGGPKWQSKDLKV